MTYPKIVKVYLYGKLNPWVTAKDLILELLKILTTKGNVGSIIEFVGPGLVNLSVPERATIANMGAELGVTTSVFPSDEITRNFFKAQGREHQWSEIHADKNALYDQTIEIDLDQLEPNIALPHSPDNVCKIRDIERISVDQVLIGSCTNSSYKDLMVVAELLKGKKIHPRVSLGIAPGSRQVLRMISSAGALTSLIEAGARILESTCGFCVGYGQSPHSKAVSLRTNNRNFEGRSGTKDAQVYIVSPESAVAAALTGYITDPRRLHVEYPFIDHPKSFFVDDSLIIKPTFSQNIYRGPNIGTVPVNKPLVNNFRGRVAIKVSNKITTDHIIPAGSSSRYRSNIEKSSRYVFLNLDKDFPDYCDTLKGENIDAVIIAGWSYGQGSSREHAALCPSFLGVRVVIAKSIERIHMSNLINSGIAPLLFKKEEDYELIKYGDNIEIKNIKEKLITKSPIIVQNNTSNTYFEVYHCLTNRQIEILTKGGFINYRLSR